MKQNLGKIILFFLLAIDLFATSVDIKLSAPAIYRGDDVSFTISVKDGDANFPNITDIKGYPILGISSSSSQSYINGKSSKTISKTYTFAPLQDVVIPSFKIEVNGDDYWTKSKKIAVLKPAPSKNGDDFIVQIKANKTHLKVGQSTIFTILFKQRIDANADKLNINEPKIDNFWVKKISGAKQYRSQNYIVTPFSYLIFAQKAGDFTINPIEADIGKLTQNNMGGFFNDPFFNSLSSSIKWRKIFSNSLKIKVDPLPNNMELYGDFKIDAKVDKTQVYINKPVNLTIKISGIGNINDIQKFNLDNSDKTVYADEPIIKEKLIGNKYGGTFTQKIAIISSDDFTIPSLSLKYVDSKTQKIKIIKTKPIKIKVLGAMANNHTQTTIQTKAQPIVSTPPKTETKIVVQKEKSYLKYIFLVLGLILGVVVTYIVLKRGLNNTTQENHITKKIRSAKSDKELFELLLPYSKENKVVSDILKQLEENIYNNAHHKIDKQKLYDIFLD